MNFWFWYGSLKFIYSDLIIFGLYLSLKRGLFSYSFIQPVNLHNMAVFKGLNNIYRFLMGLLSKLIN